MSAFTVTQWRCIMHSGYQTVTSNSVWEDTEGWTDFETATAEYRSLDGLSGVYLESRELTVTRYKRDEALKMTKALGDADATNQVSR